MERYITRTPFLELVGTCASAAEALYQLGQSPLDLIFLDIEMPGISGIELLQLLPAVRPSIIIVTADPTYALEGYEQQVTDYLLKPVSFDRFLKAVSKVLQSKPLELLSNSANISKSQEKQSEIKVEDELPLLRHANNFLLLNENKKIIKVSIHEIHIVEAMGDYVRIYWSNRVSVIHMTMSKMSEILPRGDFLRVSRSNIINKNAIKEIVGNRIMTFLDKKVSIGITYKNEVLAELRKNMINQNDL